MIKVAKKLNRHIVGSLLIASLLTACVGHDEGAEHDHAHGDDHSHEHHHEDDIPKGPNGGQLIEQDGITFEVKIEEGLSPRFRIWLSDSKGPVNRSETALSLATERFTGAREQFAFVPDETGWIATTAVGEPHSFDVTLSATIGDKNISTRYESYEGRTEIAADAARGAGVVSAQVEPGSIAETLTVIGAVRPGIGAQAWVTARFPGVIRSIRKQVGDPVQQGDLIATIDSNLSLSTYEVKSPISGVVIERYLEVGAAVDADPILKIIDPTRLQVELQLFGNEVHRIKVGQTVIMAATHGDESQEGRITRIQPAIDKATQGATAYVALSAPNSEWLAGAAVSAQIILDDTPVTVRVPRSALQKFRDWDVVFIRQGDIFEAQPVVIGRMDLQFAEIISGLVGNEEIVVEQSFLIKADIEKSGAVHDH